jgi:hypothetical protein
MSRAGRWASAASTVGLLLGGLVAVQAAGQAPASAALPGAVVRDALTPFNTDQTTKTAQAICPEGTQVTGGGGRVNGGAGRVVLTRMQPVDTNNRDRYDVTAIANGTVALPWAVQAFAICATLADIDIRVTTVTDGGRPYRDAIAGCPTGTERVGGGGRVNGGQGKVSLAATGQPVFTASVRAAGFESQAVAEAWSVTAYAVCAPAGTSVVTRRQSGPIDLSSPKIVPVTCPSGHRVTGGGAELFDMSSNQQPVVLEAVVPDVLPGGVPGNRVQVIARAFGAADNVWTVIAHAHCG